MRPKAVGGTGGIIPLRHIPVLLAAARTRGVHLSAEDFLPTVSSMVPIESPWSCGPLVVEQIALAPAEVALPTNDSERSEFPSENAESCSELSELFTETRKETL